MKPKHPTRGGIPRFLAHLERHGEYPVPFIVLRDPDHPIDFRVICMARVLQCVRDELCAICGKQLGEFSYFIGGPGCRKNHVFVDPPMHKECADYSKRTCPFVSGKHPDYSSRPTPAPELLIAERPPHVVESIFMLKARTKYTRVAWMKGGGIAVIAGPWVGCEKVR
jgi:hypothetical protein